MKKDTNDNADIRVSIGGNATGNAIGNNASVKANVISGGSVTQDEQIAKLFEQVLAAVNARPPDPKVDKEEIFEAIQELRTEVQKADVVDESMIKRRLRAVGRMAPDILDVIIETFKSPALGIASVIRKIALRIKEETQS